MSEYPESSTSSTSSSPSSPLSPSSSYNNIMNISIIKTPETIYNNDENRSNEAEGDTIVMMHSRTRMRKVMRKTYVHDKNFEDKNCEVPYCSRSLRHFDECQNLDCKDCMHLIGMCLSHH